MPVNWTAEFIFSKYLTLQLRCQHINLKEEICFQYDNLKRLLKANVRVYKQIMTSNYS